LQLNGAAKIKELKQQSNKKNVISKNSQQSFTVRPFNHNLSGKES